MRARDFIKEVFDKPYSLTWEHNPGESHDALVKLPDSTNLNIMFSLDYDAFGNEVWAVEFWRNNRLDVSGEGDSQRIFASVLDAIQQFIKLENPERIRFSAEKEIEPGQTNISRSNLYNRLVQRYARSWGYSADIANHKDSTIYNLEKTE